MGFIEIEVPINYWTFLGLPFDVNGDNVSSVFSDGVGNPYITVGTNPVISDQIMELWTGITTWYNSVTNTWMGDFADVIRSRDTLNENDKDFPSNEEIEILLERLNEVKR